MVGTDVVVVWATVVVAVGTVESGVDPVVVVDTAADVQETRTREARRTRARFIEQSYANGAHPPVINPSQRPVGR